MIKISVDNKIFGTMKAALDIVEIYSKNTSIDIIRGDAELLEKTLKDINDYVLDVQHRIRLLENGMGE